MLKPPNTKSADRFVDDVCRMVIRPVIGILLRFGLSFAKFSDIARSVYVDVASKEFGVGGRRTNTSRIALLTGLSRTRVKQELDTLADNQPRSERIEQVRPASRMLMAWHADSVFLDSQGKPLELSLNDDPVSFKLLYEKYSGNIVPMTAMLKELMSVGAVKKTKNGLYQVLNRSYTPRPSDPGAMERVCMAVRDLAETGAHNIYRNEKQRARFERFATNRLIPADEMGNFTDFLNTEAQAFLERADDWLTERETNDSSKEVIRMGVGVYQIAPSEPLNASQKNEKK